LGYTLIVDGIFGSATTYAVKNFQKSHALTMDGIVGPATQNSIAAALIEIRRPEGVDNVNLMVGSEKITVWATVIGNEYYVRLKDLPKLGLCKSVEWDERNRIPKIQK